MSTKSKNHFTIKYQTRAQRYYRNFAAGLGAFLLAYICASILTPVEASDAQEVTIKNNVTGYYVTVSNSDAVNLSVNAVTTGAYSAAKDTINVKTNAPSGYQLYISAASSTLYNSTDTAHTGLALSPVNGTLASKNTLSLNTWGFTLNDASTAELQATDIWAQVPDTSTELISETSAPDETGVDTDIYFGVRANSSLAEGQYGTTIYYTAVAEGATEPFMQDFTAADCAAMSTDSTTRLMDLRNQGIYTIVKAKDGNCWMADNLQIDNVVINSADSNIPQGTTFTIPESSNWSGNIYNEAKLHIATNSGYEGEHYYNWFTATAGSTESTAGATVDQSICPKGWRLPINGDATQDKSYTMLFNKYGITTGPQVVTNTILGFTYSGIWLKDDPGSESRQGSEGYSWSSTPTSGTDARLLHYYSRGDLYPQSDINKSYGLSVRCVFEGETIQDITTMQQMTGTICNNTRTGATARLEDIRGRGNAGSAEDDTYGVIKAKDGNCWMTTNFDLYNKQISATDSDFTSGTYTLPDTSTWNTNIYNAPKIHRATTSGYTDQVYYNWTTAVALQDGSTTNQQDQSICPKNWQLPTDGGASQNKTYAKLLNAYSITTGAQLLSSVLGVTQYYGSWYFGNGGQENSLGVYGCFWSSTPDGADMAKYFDYWSSGVRPQTSNYKGRGFGIRCVSRQ